MTVCGNASVWAKIGAILVVVAFALQCAGFGTKYWEQNETIQENTVLSFGLWKAENCSGGHDAPCDSMDIPSKYTNGSFNAVRGMEIFVMVLMFFLMILFVLYVASDKFREMSVGIFIAVMCFVIAFFGVIAMIIWVAQLPTDFYPGYSFGLCVFASLLVFLAGILMIPDLRQFNKTKNRNRDPVRVLPSNMDSKYSDRRYQDRSYNRKFTTPEPETEIRHYYNPNRKPFVRSPPPSYGRISPPMRKTKPSLARSEVQTPDVYLGRDGRHPRRF